MKKALIVKSIRAFFVRQQGIESPPHSAGQANLLIKSQLEILHKNPIKSIISTYLKAWLPHFILSQLTQIDTLKIA